MISTKQGEGDDAVPKPVVPSKADVITNGETLNDITLDDPHSFGPASLPENCVEYVIFLIDQQLESSNVLTGLEAVKKAGIQLMEGLTKDYIWQREGFRLEIRSHAGLLHLHGVTDHGDSVEDEWLIVYVLRELSKSFENVWIRVFDSDGEFLLVEAANVAPKWLNPEMDGNRVWIHQGKLLLIPPASGSISVSKSISLPDAVAFIRSQAASMVHSSFVESEAFYRLEKYPSQITDSVHYSLITIPRKLAYVLHDRPKSIAPAVEAFYLRDPRALKPLLAHPPSRQLEFPPVDLVSVSVRFTKVLFAQLWSQRFEPPPAWVQLLPRLPPESDIGSEPHSARARLELGMKVTTGFELLAACAEKSRSRVAREVAIVLEDLGEDGVDALPTDAEISTWKEVDRDDDESWLNIDYADFERELDGTRQTGTSVGPGKGDTGFGDANAQADLRKIVERFEAFLNDDDAGIDGAEVDDMDFDDDENDDSDEDSDEEDKEVSFDEEEFARMMREMMGLPATDSSSKGPPARPAGPPKGSAASGHDEHEIKAIEELAAQMEAELNEHGALKLDRTPKQLAALKGKTPARGESSSIEVPAQRVNDDSDNGDDEDEDDDDSELNIDYNLAKNLLESFKSQAGMAGPASNMLGMMGMGLPRDEDDKDNQNGK